LLWLAEVGGTVIAAWDLSVDGACVASLLLPDVAHTATHKPLTMHTGQQALLQ